MSGPIIQQSYQHDAAIREERSRQELCGNVSETPCSSRRGGVGGASTSAVVVVEIEVVVVVEMVVVAAVAAAVTASATGQRHTGLALFG
jgi:hypothetical protein